MNKLLLSLIFLFAVFLASFSLNTQPEIANLENKLTKSNDYQPSQEKSRKQLASSDVTKKALEDQVEYQKILESEEQFNNALAELQQELETVPEANQDQQGTVLDLSTDQESLGKSLIVNQETPQNINQDPNNQYFELTPSEIEALNNSGASSPNSNSGLIGGVHNGPAVAAVATDDSEEDLGTTAEAFQELPQLTGQPRGYVMLYLMHPKARETVNAQVEGLVVSGIRNLYLSVLIDGTFGKDFEFLKNNIKKLSDSADSLTLALYLTNGATMRRWNQTSIDAGFNLLEPKLFRDLIQNEERAKNEFRAIVRDAEPIFAYNSSLNINNKNIAIVMLEDNLDRASYIAMRNLARDILGNRVQYIRNACPGCYPGNDTTTDGDALEIHNPEGVFEMNAGTGFTNDGKSYRFQGEPVSSESIAIEDLEDRMLMADSRGGKYFGLWRSQRQGYSIPPIHPDERTYELPTVKQLITELQLLRSGLKEVQN